MSRLLKFSKPSEAENQEYVDLISTLPDDVLGYMLSFLLTKCAVGTSILSSRWRCLYTLTNCLAFDEPREFRKLESNAQKESYKNFVTRVLLVHQLSPIKKFHFDSGRHTYDDSDYYAWIRAALLKGVEQLHLVLGGRLRTLPHRLFHCQKIVDLKIDSCLQGLSVPESTRLPSLKILHLSGLTFYDKDSLSRFFYACPSLQELTVNNCKWPSDSNHLIRLSSWELTRLTINYRMGRIEVSAPNLVYLECCYKGLDVALSLKNSDRLVTACLEFTFTENPDSIHHALALVKAVCHAKELQLLGGVAEGRMMLHSSGPLIPLLDRLDDTTFISSDPLNPSLIKAYQYLTRAEDDQIPSFPNLVKFYLGRCSYDCWEHITHRLADSPLLETLIFKQGLVKLGSWQNKWHLSLPFSSRVKVIEVHYFHGDTVELVVLKHLLKNAKALKRLTLYKIANYMTKKRELNASWKLMLFQRGSKTCAIQMFGQLKQ